MAFQITVHILNWPTIIPSKFIVPGFGIAPQFPDLQLINNFFITFWFLFILQSLVLVK